MRLKPFLSDSRGNVAIVFAFSLVPLLGVSGFALDYARASRDQSGLQSAADAAALAAIQVKASTAAARVDAATRVFNANKPSDVSVTPLVDATTKQAVVTASAQVPTSLMKALRIDTVSISARAKAVTVYDGPQPCVMALSKTGVGIQIGGADSFTGKNCALHSNSSTTGAITVSGSATVKADGYCAVGTVSSTVPLTPPPESSCDELPDPYANLLPPAFPSCTFNNKNLPPSPLSPDCVYEGGLSLKGDVTLKPGLYIVRNGPLTINAQSNVTGDGVTFYLTGTGAGFDITAGTTLRLTAMRDGPYAGLLIVQDRNSNVGATNTLNGNATAVLVGAVYTPTQNLTLNGNSSFGQGSPYMPLIANTVKITGSNVTEISVDTTNVPVVTPLPREASGARLTE